MQIKLNQAVIFKFAKKQQCFVIYLMQIKWIRIYPNLCLKNYLQHLGIGSFSLRLSKMPIEGHRYPSCQ
jgi:hypothetical protein